MIFAQTLGLRIKSIDIEWLSKLKKKMNSKFITEASICFQNSFLSSYSRNEHTAG